MLLTPPMTMMDFFRKSEGVWFTQRTVHNFDTAAADESGESNVIVEVLSIDDRRLLDVCNPTNPRTGKFLRNRGYVEGIPVIGVYHFADDGVLTIETEYETNQGQERCWFINDHFRVRVMTVQMVNGVKQMAYCSERRCISHSALEEMIEQNRLRFSGVGVLSP